MFTADDTDISSAGVPAVHPGIFILLLVATSSGQARTERVGSTADQMVSVISDPPVPVARPAAEVEISAGVSEHQNSSAELAGRTVVSVTLRKPLRP